MMAIAAPWMLSNLFVASLIAMTAWVVGRSGRHAWLAHGLWVMVLIKMVSPPIISVPIIPLAEFTRIFDPPTIDVNLDQPVTEVVKTFGSPVTEFIPETYAEILGEFRSDSHRFNGSRWIGCIWGLGAIIVLCVEASKMLRFRRLLASEGKFDPRATAFVDTLLAGGKLGSRRFHSPRVVRVPLRVSPMLFGLGWRPVIVCPDSLWRELPPRTRQAFLAHEAAHYSRGDHWIRGLEWIVRSVYWWFPPLRWVRGSIQRHEEVCCDRWAIDRLSLPPRRYAESLLSVVDFIADHEVGIPAMASGMRPTAELEERLRLMMRRGSLSSPSRKFKSIAIMIAIALLCIHPTVLASRLDNQTQELLVTDVNAFDDIKMATVAEVAEVAEVAAASPLEPMSSDLARTSRMPPDPQGFWNSVPPDRWAGHSSPQYDGLRMSMATVVAETGRGISVHSHSHSPIHFASGTMTAMTRVVSTGQIIVGDDRGNVKLWDTQVGTPVSLIGRHSAAITSLSFHPNGGLVAADAGGSSHPLGSGLRRTRRIMGVSARRFPADRVGSSFVRWKNNCDPDRPLGCGPHVPNIALHRRRDPGKLADTESSLRCRLGDDRDRSVADRLVCTGLVWSIRPMDCR